MHLVKSTNNKDDNNNYKSYDYEQSNLIENFSNKKNVEFELLNYEKVVPINQKYSIHYNIYNVSFLIILIFLFFYANKIGRPSPSPI